MEKHQQKDNNLCLACTRMEKMHITDNIRTFSSDGSVKRHLDIQYSNTSIYNNNICGVDLYMWITK